MNTPKFTYTTIYNEDSFRDFAYVLHKCRGRFRKIAILLFALFFGLNSILMVISQSGDIPTALVMFLLSGFLFLYLKNTPKRLAKAMIRNSQDFDEYRKITFSFFDSYLQVLDLDIETKVDYSKLYDIVVTSQHIFLFTKPRVAYIMACENIENSEELLTFLNVRTGKEYTYLTH